MTKLKWLNILIVLLLISSCRDEDVEPLQFPKELMSIPNGFDEIEAPEDNQFTQVRWELGKKLFYDPIMSADSTISCASCHNPTLAFSDEVSLSLGVEDRLGTRNAPTLANVGYHPYYTREGGVPTLEMQIFVPIQEHNEFDFNIVLLAERLAMDSNYVELSQQAYARTPDPFTITRSLACFERSLISGFSPYDQFINYEDQDAMTSSEIKGMDLFFGDKTNCSTCHGGFNFTNYEFENNGLYLEYEDPGRFRLTGDDDDLARFKVPSLRNIEITAPYMHDGSISTLSEVIEHYNSGGYNHPHKNAFIRPLGLTETEKDDLESFINSLTDQTFVSNPLFK